MIKSLLRHRCIQK